MSMPQVRFMDDEEIVCNVNGEETVDDVKRKVSVETGEPLENSNVQASNLKGFRV